ncbi:hypothetical protein [Malacoplasma muris]|uniref:hypothetical protein n=1 Tax=Malacoplasma muris TaxID=2119 RepID=UPI00398F58DC
MKGINKNRFSIYFSFNMFFAISFVTSIAVPNFNCNSITNTNAKSSSVDNNTNTNATQETSVWQKTIEESSGNTNVKVFFTRNATIAFQQALIATNYMLQSKDQRTGSDEIVWFVDYDLYDSKKYNFDYYNLTYGPNLNGSSNFNFSLWSRLGKTPSNESNNTSDNYRVMPSDYQIGNFLNYYIDKYGQDVKFDVWIPDISLKDVWNSSISQNSPTSFYRFFKHVNKFNIISDGNWQTLNLATNMVDRLNKKNYVQLSETDLDQMVSSFQNDANDQMYSTFKQYDLYDYLHYSKMFTIFHTKSYTSSPYYKYPKDKIFYTAHSIDYDYVSMSNKFFANDNIKKEKYVYDFESFFNIQNNTSISDFVWKNIENYDPKKKNIVWMGDSLIRPDSNGNEIYRYPEKQEEINSIVEAYIQKFPVSEYNYFVKHHPSFSHEYQENLNQYLFKDLIDPICMNPFPWELFLSWDHKMQTLNNPTNVYSPFFSETSNNDKTPFTKLVGIQYTTTTIQTTAFYLSTTYGMNLEKINKTVGLNDWPIPMTFDIVERTTGYFVNPFDQYQINYKKIEKIYAPFYELQIFPDYRNKVLSSYDYINEFGSHSFILKVAYTPQYFATIALISIFALSLFITVSVCLVKKHNRNKATNK